MKATDDSDTFVRRPQSAFTLVELLIVIAVIGIMSALIVTSIINATQDSRMVVARQQQVVFQQALGAWIAAESSGPTNLESVRSKYNSNSTSQARFNLITNYLLPAIVVEVTTNTTNPNQLITKDMARAGASLQFSTWGTNGPMVEMTQ